MSEDTSHTSCATEPGVAAAKGFSQRFFVPADAIDELGHVSNLEWVRWISRIATAHSESVGLGFTAYRSLGLLWVVRRHEVDYLAEALEGEDIEARTWIADVKGATSRRSTTFHRLESDGTRKLLVRAETTWALIDLARRRPTRVPSDLLERYGFTPAAPTRSS
ncbi:MAG: acyl-CoA thioesterase [Myxococcales bacterium]|nr:acyl-CoA thioesterase [Myxococcales bacterium]